MFHRVLRQLRALDIDDERRRHAEHAMSSLSRDTRKQRRRRRPDTDATLIAATATGATDRPPDTPVPNRRGTVGYFHRPRRCYACKAEYWKVHALYHALCPSCAAGNATRRDLTTDLRGRRALLTGGRVKIGFHLALKLLRDGAEVHVTTRFPLDAHRRFAAVGDSAAWLDRLHIIGIDLRDPRQVLALCERFRAEHGSLDILVNNAAQTIRRPAASYAVLTAAETDELPPGVRLTAGFRTATAVDPAWTLPAVTPAAVPSSGDRREAVAAVSESPHGAAGPRLGQPTAEPSAGGRYGPAVAAVSSFAGAQRETAVEPQGGGDVSAGTTSSQAASAAPSLDGGEPSAGGHETASDTAAEPSAGKHRAAGEPAFGAADARLDPSAASPPADPVAVDESGLLPDPASSNSWSVSLGELDAAEVLEAQLVNSLAPALLCDGLLPLLRASRQARRYIVNVSAVEGRFAVRNKTPNHPHTNMAKAALNMLTRTSGAALAAEGIFMCSVDTGWITDENPEPRKANIAAAGFRTPLDVVDGAARVYDPIVRGEAGNPVSGIFLKDYREAQW